MNNALRTDFRRKCGEHITDPGELAYMEALFEESSEIRSIPVESLWKALNFPLRWVQVHALYELFRRRDQAPLAPLSPKTRILMLGQHAWTQEDLGPILEKIGHTLIDLHTFIPGTGSPVNHENGETRNQFLSNPNSDRPLSYPTGERSRPSSPDESSLSGQKGSQFQFSETSHLEVRHEPNSQFVYAAGNALEDLALCYLRKMTWFEVVEHLFAN